MDYRKSRKKKIFLHLISSPFIWLPLLPLMAFDICVEIYQFVCFPIYGIEKVKRSAYVQVMDRNRLQYLEPLEKLGCMYCGYTNGVLLYFKEIAGRTEKYWCGIMHEGKPGFKTQDSQVAQDFAQFGDEQEFNKKYPIQ